MTTISPVSTTPLPVQTVRDAMITSDFNTFLRMLTTQIQNQDPLNPMQSTEFATQLATFSGVEQQVRTNEQLAGLATQLGLANLVQMSGWIGMEVRTSGEIRFAGAPLELDLTPAAQADAAELIVIDPSGTEVQRLAVSPLATTVDWAGTTADGLPLPSGNYRFRLESFAKGATLGQSEVAHYSRVEEARADGSGGVTLLLQGGVTASASAVSALRRDAGF